MMTRKIVAALLVFFSVGVIWGGLTQAGAQPVKPNIKDGWYQIGTADELAWFRDAVNDGGAELKARLTADIDLKGSEDNQWVRIGTIVGSDDNMVFTPFSGIFDGQGHKISGLYIHADNKDEKDGQGLFGVVSGDKAEIRDLAIAADINLEGTRYIGGLAGMNSGGKISGCSVSGTVTSDSDGGYRIAGGVVGYNLRGGIIENCKSSVNLSKGDRFVGGILGYGKDGQIKSSSASGTVSSPGKAIGGIAGEISLIYLGGGKAVMPAAIKDCAFTGELKGAEEVGGICGHSSGTGYDPEGELLAYISGCTVAGGSVTGGGDVGGVVGYNKDTIVSNCRVSVNVSAVAGLTKANDGQHAGGIAGQMPDDDTVVKDCFSTGNVSADNGFAGGIVGLLRFGTVTGCVAKGDVASGAHHTNEASNGATGGIVGGNEGGKIYNCASSGTITSSGENAGAVGGIAGAMQYIISEAGTTAFPGVVNCAAFGNVSADIAVGGIVGQNDAGFIVNCAALGEVSGPDKVGGVVGFSFSGADKHHALIRNCSVLGKISGNTMAGGIVGKNGDKYNESDVLQYSDVENCVWPASAGPEKFYGEWVAGTSADVVSRDSLGGVVTAFTVDPTAVPCSLRAGQSATVMRSFPGKDAAAVSALNLSVSGKGVSAVSDAVNCVSVTGVASGDYTVSADLTLTATKFGEGAVAALKIGTDVPAIAANVAVTSSGGGSSSSGCSAGTAALALLAALPLALIGRKRRAK